MLAHPFDIFYVITKFIWPSVDDLKFPSIDFNLEFSYINADLSRHQNAKQYLSYLKPYYEKIVSFIDFIRNKLIIAIKQLIKF